MVLNNTQHIDVAAQCFFNGLLREYACWRLEKSQQTIVITLDYQQKELLLRLKQFSSFGFHQFYFPLSIKKMDQVESDEINFGDAVLLLLAEPAIAENADVTLFVKRVLESHQITHNSIVQRKGEITERLNRPMPFIEAEQALFVGHSMHPAPKYRSALLDNDVIYAPESGMDFGLHWIAIDKKVLETESAIQSIEQLVTEIIDDLQIQLPQYPSDFQALPMHPWQAQQLFKRQDISLLQRDKQLIDLGNHGDGWRATTSVRAIYHPNCRHMLKFSLSLKLTNSVRHLSLKEVQRGVRLEKVLTSKYAQQWRQRYPEMEILSEPAFAAIKFGANVIEESIFAVRNNPFFTQPERQSMVLATLTQANPFKQENLITSLVASYASEKELSNQKAAQIWFSRFLERIIEPLICARCDYGLIFLAHQQNIIVDLEDNLPNGLFYRDCQGTGFTCTAKELFAKELGEHIPENYMPKEFVDPYICYYLIFNSTFSVISSLAATEGVNEQQLIKQMQLFLIHQQQKNWRDDSLLTYLLSSPTLLYKANFHIYLSNVNESTVEDPTRNYHEMANPLKVESLPNYSLRLIDGQIIAVNVSSSQITLMCVEQQITLNFRQVANQVQLSLQQPLFKRLQLTFIYSFFADFCLRKNVTTIKTCSKTWSLLCCDAAPSWASKRNNEFIFSRMALEQLPEIWLEEQEMPPVSGNETANGVFPLRAQLSQKSVLYRRYFPSINNELTIRTVDPIKDLDLFHHWMNQKRVAHFWELNKDKATLKDYLIDALQDQHQTPVLACLDGKPFGYFELYWVGEDRLGPYCNAQDYDRGLHLLIGDVGCLGQKYWQVWGTAVGQYCFLADNRTQRLLGEPRVDNKQIRKIWEFFGYQKHGEFDFPHKRSSLVMAERQDFFNALEQGELR